MSKPRKGEEAIDPQLWLAKVLRSRFDKIIELYSAPLMHPRSEGVHHMRVAIRRMRSALRDFAQLTNKLPLKKIRKRLKLLGDLLGDVRDLDVAIEAFAKAAKDTNDAAIKTGIAEIVEDCKNNRRAAYARLQEHLVRTELAELTARFEHAFHKSLRQREIFSARTVGDAGRAIIESCLERFLSDVDAIYDPFAVRQIHQLRISGKHLRYSIELFEDVWEGKLQAFVEDTKEMQAHLGDLHDRDFWIAGSSKRISLERPRSENEEVVYKARIWLLSEFTQQRMNSYRSALTIWSEWRSSDFAGRLRKVLADG